MATGGPRSSIQLRSARVRAEPCEVASRSRQALNEAGVDRVRGNHRNDRDRQGRLSRRDRHRVETHDYDVHVEPDEVGHELWQPLGPAIREAMVDDEVLPHPVPALSEPIFQSTNQREYILSRRYPRHIRRALEPTHRR